MSRPGAGMWPASGVICGAAPFEKVARMNINYLVSLRLIALPLSLLIVAGLVGCSGRVSLLPNSDKSLRRTPAQFASEAAKRSYDPDMPDGGTARARAQVAYESDSIQILNDSEEDWVDVEIWVNHKYVMHMPRIEAGRKRVKTLTFLMLYDDHGNPFPRDNRKQMIDSLELVRDGMKYKIPLVLAD